MKSTLHWAIGVGLVAGLIAGCDQNKNKPVEVSPSTTAPPVTAAPAYPSDSALPPAPPPVTAAPPSDTYTPPPPADTTPIPPEERPAAKARSRTPHTMAKSAPREHYAPATPKSGQTYTVKQGDTLQEISQKYYGTTKRWQRIFQANRKALHDDPNKLVPGMKLVIPGK